MKNAILITIFAALTISSVALADDATINISNINSNENTAVAHGGNANQEQNQVEIQGYRSIGAILREMNTPK